MPTISIEMMDHELEELLELSPNRTIQEIINEALDSWAAKKSYQRAEWEDFCRREAASEFPP